MTNSGKFKLAGRWIAGTCVAVSAVGLPWLWARPSAPDEPPSEIRRITGVWYDGRVDEFMRTWNGLDLTMRDAAGAGNVVLRFEGFNPDVPGHVKIVQEACWRGAYAVYPRRVLVGPEGTVINNAHDVLAAGFDPSMQWMQEHDVRAVLHFYPIGQDGFRIRPQAIPPAGGR